MHKYEIIIYWSNEDGAFVAEAPELPVLRQLTARAIPAPEKNSLERTSRRTNRPFVSSKRPGGLETQFQSRRVSA